MVEESEDLARSMLKMLSKFDPQVLGEAVRKDPELINTIKAKTHIKAENDIEW